MTHEIVTLTNQLTKLDGHAFAHYSPMVLSREVSAPGISKDRATALAEKRCISVNVYAGGVHIEYVVSAERLAPFVARFLSDIEGICQEKSILPYHE